MATITFQNFFRMYDKLSGMTGTAATEAVEFNKIYNLDVVAIPTNLPVARIDENDEVYLNETEKWEAIANEIKTAHEKGQPVLVGTVSVEKSEHLSAILTRKGIRHEVLNAKNHAREAEIIAHAGELGAITISTNMAGRGTDIKLGEGVKELGGLAVLGTERFESRRIDNQLRGRSGRQGDPGYSCFFISCEDELMQRFGGDAFKARLATIVRMMNEDDETKPIESKMLVKMVTMAQTKIEGLNYDSRKNVLKYDDVVRRQRETFYAERQQVVKALNLVELLKQIMKSAITNKVNQFMESDAEFDDEKLTKTFNERMFGAPLLDVNVIKGYDEDTDIINYIYDACVKEFSDRLEKIKADLKEFIPEEVQKEDPAILDKQIMLFIKRIILPILDRNWREHIDDMQGFRQGIYLQQYAQTNPLELYQSEGYERFKRLNAKMNEEILISAMHARIRVTRKVEEPKDELKGLRTNQDLSTVNSKQPVRKEANPNAKFVNVGPNAPCPCGSGKKFKFCHGLRR